MIPKVSICIPTYNGEEFISCAIESVLKQTYTNCEIVISDDESRDGTLEVAKKSLANSPFPFKIIQHLPSSIGANWNNCIDHASGKYIKFLFQDDLLAPSCVEKMARLAETDSNIGLVFSKRNIVVEDDCNIDTAQWCENYKDLSRAWTPLLIRPIKGRKLLSRKDFLISPDNKIGEPIAVLFPKSVWHRVGPFSETLFQDLDYEYWYRIMAFYKIAYIPEELATFRLHGNQATQKNTHDNVDEGMHLVIKSWVGTPVFRRLHFSIRREVVLKIMREKALNSKLLVFVWQLIRPLRQITNKLTSTLSGRVIGGLRHRPKN